MRKEFSAISAFSGIIAFTAGIVLCMQIAQANIQLGLELPGAVMWMIEIAIFGAAVYAWQKQVSFTGWMIGIACMAVIRIAIISGSGYALALVRDAVNIGPVLALTGTTLPRLCAVAFALMICYPIRVVLPRRTVGEPRRRFAEGAAGRGGEQGSNGLLIVTVNERSAAIEGPRAEVQFHGSAPTAVSTMRYIEGEVELPLSMVLALMPEHIVTDRALALCDAEVVHLPLEVIVPQLREAQVVFSVADLREHLPVSVRKALLSPTESDIETENGLVALPLKGIIPQLPEGTLQLPSPSVPAWAKIETDQRIVFATT